MKLICQLEIRSQLAPSSAKKACSCTLALCKDKKNAPVLLVCTKQNIAGQKYEVKKLKKVYSKFVKDGMSTLSFTAPPHDLLIRKADPLQLQSFLHFLVKGEKSNLRFSAPPTRIEAAAPKKLVVTHRSDLPLPLPKTLESLIITNIGLIKVPKSTWQLEKLSTLNLSSNSIESLPADLGRLSNLSILVLAQNSLTSLNNFPRLKSLQHLDLSYNKLSSLPESLCDLPALQYLELRENVLTKLPDGIGRLRKLKFLSASLNKIQVLPSSFKCLRLEHLDLYKNPLECPVTPDHRPPPSIPSLLEWAAQSTIHHSLPFSEECLPSTLVYYLRTRLLFCAECAQPVFTSTLPAVCLVDIKTVAYEVVAVDSKGRYLVPVEVTRCFRHCWQK